MTKRPTAEPPSERQLSKQLGISRAVFWRAKQVASIPEEEFEAMSESDHPPTVSQLVEHARGQPDRSQEVSIRLKPDQLAALDVVDRAPAGAATVAAGGDQTPRSDEPRGQPSTANPKQGHCGRGARQQHAASIFN